MTTLTADRPAVAATTERADRALALRRALLIAAPVLGGLFCIVGAVADPASGIAGDKMVKIYIDHPDALQWKSTAFHWAYALWIGTALMVAPLVRGRGAWLATIGAVLGFIGMTTLPGMLVSDWFEAGIGHFYGLQGVKQVEDHIMSTMWGVKGFVLPGLPTLALALPLAAAALWRARRVRWWSFAATVAAFVVFLASNVTWWGTVLTTVFLTVFAVSLFHATKETPAAG